MDPPCGPTTPLEMGTAPHRLCIAIPSARVNCATLNPSLALVVRVPALRVQRTSVYSNSVAKPVLHISHVGWLRDVR